MSFIVFPLSRNLLLPTASHTGPFFSADDLTSHSSEKIGACRRGLIHCPTTRSINFPLVHCSLISLLLPIKLALLLLKTNLPHPHPLYTGSYTLSLLKDFAPWIFLPLLDHSIHMQTCFCFPSSKNKITKTPLTPYIICQLSPFYFSSKHAYFSCLHFLTFHSLLYLSWSGFCPYHTSEAALVKVSNDDLIVKSNGYFSFVLNSASQ